MSSADWTGGVAAILWLFTGLLGFVASGFALYAWNAARQEGTAKDDALRRFQDESKVAVSNAQARSDEAKRESALATEGAANANVEVAKANERTSAAQLELEKLKATLAWREISDQQIRDFCVVVASLPKTKVSFSYLNNDPEAASFAAQILDMLRKAGYDTPENLEYAGIVTFGAPMVGVTMSVSNPDDSAAGFLQNALSGIGISAPAQLVKAAPDKPNIISINVGQKPRPRK